MTPHSTTPNHPELLAPAGDWDAMRAAVANGADAVYFGLSNFNARHRATNFTTEELPEVMRYLHAHNVRGYVTFNTLIFSDELPDAVTFIKAIAAAGADAVIVQDLGLARLVHRVAPTLPVHGSTQMTLTEPRGVAFVKELGVERVILARELTASEIGRIAKEAPLPVEVFIHGALCIAYSGQCLTSESIGGRSANRGQCAQACRLPYDLIVDGKFRDLGDKAYLLSPQDLAAHELIGELTELGVCSFKIEGRLKSAHYVAATTQAYRSALNAAIDQRVFALSQQQQLDLQQSFSRGFTHGFLSGVNHQELVPARFPKSRGVRIGTVVEVTERGLVVEVETPFFPSPSGRGQGEGLSSPSSSSPHRAQQRKDPHPNPSGGLPKKGEGVGGLKPGDGVVFDEGHPEQDEQGGRVFEVRPWRDASSPSTGWKPGASADAHASRNSGSPTLPGGARGGAARGAEQIEVIFGRGDVNLAAVAVGSIVWKTDDPALRRRLEQSYARETVANRTKLDVEVHAIVGEKLRVTLRDGTREAVVEWEQPLAKAQKHPLTVELLREQFGRLGDTPYELGSVTLVGSAKPQAGSGGAGVSEAMVPKSVLNDLRRRAVEMLLAQRGASASHAVVEPDALQSLRSAASRGVSHRSSSSFLKEREQIGAARPGSLLNSLFVLARTDEQLDAALAFSPRDVPGVAMVYLDFEDIRRYKDAVARAKAAGVPIGLATTRVQKVNEEGLLRLLARYEPDAVLVRNLASLSYYKEHFPALPLVADYSLNVANELTAAILAESGVVRMVPSYDLNWQQMAALFARFPVAAFEAVVHQHMPMFHMEHCVFSHTLSNGKDHRDCGRPCEKHAVDLRDRVGLSHPLIADVGCRNTVYNGQAQSAAEYVPRMKELGLVNFRVELLRDTADQTRQTLDYYSRVIAGLEDARTARRQLRVLNQLGVTAGTLER